MTSADHFLLETQERRSDSTEHIRHKVTSEKITKEETDRLIQTFIVFISIFQ